MIVLQDGKGHFKSIQEKLDTRPGVFYFTPLLLLILIGCFQNGSPPSPERAVEFLRTLVQDESPEIRRTAAESLGKIGDPSSIRSILSLLDDPEPIVRAAAAQALGRVGSSANDEIVVALARSLNDPVDAVRRNAAVAIAEIEPKTSQLEPVVQLAKNTRNIRVRDAAIRALWQLDISRWEGDLVPILRDSDADVRQAAVAALGQSGGSSVIGELRQRLTEDASPSVRVEAAYQLGKLPGVDVRMVLEKAAVSDPEKNVRRWAESELRSLRGSD